MDALELLAELHRLAPVDAIHASPPCQAFTRTGWAYHFGYHADHTDLLTEVRAALEATGLPWIMENVPGAPMRTDVLLCGSQFSLGVRRHRVFECSPPVFDLMPPCVHDQPIVSPVGHPNAARGNRFDWAAAMGIDWMPDRDELAQAIPPAYTECLGARLLRAVAR
jgi:DNA (cytosine-5)-methyltransferase 1